MKTRYIIALATGALVLAGCQRELLPEGDENFGDGQIRYSISNVGVKSSADDVPGTGSLSLVSGDGKLTVPVTCEVSEGIDLGSGSAETKGALINTSGSDSDLPAGLGFTVSAYKGSSPQFENKTATKSGDYWTMDPPQYWPLSTKLTFYAYTNAGDNTVSQTATSQTLTYTVTGDAAAHKDLMLGYYKGNGGNKGIAEMRFDHPLTAVRFKKGEMTGVTGIKSITISGLAKSGTVAMDADGVIGNWTVADTEKYQTKVTLAGGETALGIEESSKLIGTDSEGKYNGAFLLIPQALSDHKVTVTVVLSMESGDDVTVIADITSGIWQAGMTNTYTLGYRVTDPDLLPGRFSVSATDYVQFSRGNLFCTRSGSEGFYTYKFGLENKQYEFHTRYGVPHQNSSSQTVDPSYFPGLRYEENKSGLFQWVSTNAPGQTPDILASYGAFSELNQSQCIGNLSDVVDFGKAYGDGMTWSTLTSDEMRYLLANHITKWSNVCGVTGLVLAPDGWVGSIADSYDDSSWLAAESSGLVFLPAAGNFNVENWCIVYNVSTNGYIWSQYSYSESTACDIGFSSDGATASCAERYYAMSVRLVQKFPKPISEANWIDLGIKADNGNTLLWCDRNVVAIDASGVATLAGDIYSYNSVENAGLFDYSTAMTITSVTSPLPVGITGHLRLPTKSECDVLKGLKPRSWGEESGLAYVSITGSSNETIVFPASGFIPAKGVFGGQGTQVRVWTSTPNGDGKGAYRFYWNKTASPGCNTDNALDQCSVRLVFEVEKPELLTGVFSVSATKYVQFSRGNLQATYHTATSSYTWDFAANQYVYVGNNPGNTTIKSDGTNNDGAVVDLFGWSTAATNYGINSSTTASDYSGSFKDWGSSLGEGSNWSTLSIDEWTYLTSRTGKFGYATVAGVAGIIILPDEFSDPQVRGDSGNLPFVAGSGKGNWTDNIYSAVNWAKMEDAGAVFLPMCGYRNGTALENMTKYGQYWSATPSSDSYASYFNFTDDVLGQDNKTRARGCFVRLVQKFNKPVEYVEIAGLKWATENLAITESGKKEWKGTGHIIGDYFQWAAHAGYCGNATDADKGLLVYTSFTSTMCGDGSDAFTFKSGKQFEIENTPYYSGSAFTKYTDAEHATLDRTGAYTGNNDDVVNIILGDGWRMPTFEEFKAMRELTYWAWSDADKGYYVYMPKNENDKGHFYGEQDFTPTGSYSTEEAVLFFPAAGFGDDGDFRSANSEGTYWSSSLNSSYPNGASYLYFSSSEITPRDGNGRRGGFSVRPVHD